MSAAQSLQAAIFARLSGDATLTGMIGADGLSDRLIARATGPSLRLVRIDSRDWSTDHEPGEEHLVTLKARAGEGGHKAVQVIAARVRTVFDATPPVLSGGHLVCFEHRRTNVSRDAKAKGHVAEMIFRVLTE